MSFKLNDYATSPAGDVAGKKIVKSKAVINGVRTTVNRTEPIINGQKYYYYETLQGKFISAGKMK